MLIERAAERRCDFDYIFAMRHIDAAETAFAAAPLIAAEMMPPAPRLMPILFHDICH